MCLDRHRAMWPLINLKENNDGESLIPGLFLTRARRTLKNDTFVTFVDFAHTPPAQSQESDFAPTSCTIPRRE